MKCILFLILSFCLVSQDRIDPSPISLTFTNTFTQYNNEINQNEFVKGWNWGSDTKILDEQLLMDFNHCKPFNSSSEWRLEHKHSVGQNLLMSAPRVGHGDATSAISQAQAIIYEPGYNLNARNYYVKDETGAVFGFRNRESIFTSSTFNTSNTVGSTLRLSKDLISSTFISAILLSNVDVGDELKDISYMSKESPISHTSTTINGRAFYLTIQARALEPIHLGNGSNTIFGIRMPATLETPDFSTDPYTSTTSTTFIKFQRIPSDLPNGFTLIEDARTHVYCQLAFAGDRCLIGSMGKGMFAWDEVTSVSLEDIGNLKVWQNGSTFRVGSDINKLQINIFDLQGTQVNTEHFNKNTIIDLSDKPNGTYLFNIIHQNLIINSGKLSVVN